MGEVVSCEKIKRDIDELLNEIPNEILNELYLIKIKSLLEAYIFSNKKNNTV